MGRTFLLLLLWSVPALAFHEQVLWERAGGGPHSGMGCIILPLGDQNHDGYADWAVHSCGEGNTSASPLMTEFFHGGNPPSTTPYMTLRGSEGTYGLMVSYNAGDVNGDGYEDWLAYDNYPLTYTLVRLHYGGPEPRVDSNVVFRIAFDNLSSERVFGIGDFNGDGYDDLSWSHLQGWGRIYYGGTSPDSLADWSLTDPPEHENVGSPYGWGDVSGDGCADFAGNTIQGELTVILGGALADTLADLLCPGVGFCHPTILSDVNGDGRAEVLNTAPGGHVAIHWGGAALSCAEQSYVLRPGNSALNEITGVGDINGDGFNDFVIIDGTSGGDQVVGLYLGSAELRPQPVWTLYGWEGYGLLDLSEAAGLGDINGDGINDFALGASGDDNRRGKAVIFSGDTTLRLDAERPRAVAMAFALAAYPNPFNSTTEIRYALPRSSRVTLKVFDVTGREVCSLVDEMASAGEHGVAFDAVALASGVYFVRMQAAEQTLTRKTMLLK